MHQRGRRQSQAPGARDNAPALAIGHRKQLIEPLKPAVGAKPLGQKLADLLIELLCTANTPAKLAQHRKRGRFNPLGRE